MTSPEDILMNADLSGLEDLARALPLNAHVLLRAQRNINVVILSQICSSYLLSKHPTLFCNHYVSA